MKRVVGSAGACLGDSRSSTLGSVAQRHTARQQDQQARQDDGGDSHSYLFHYATTLCAARRFGASRDGPTVSVTLVLDDRALDHRAIQQAPMIVIGAHLPSKGQGIGALVGLHVPLV